MIHTKTPSTIHLNTGGFIIKIMHISRTKRIFLDEPILDINNLFKGFIVSRQQQADHTIFIEKKPQPLILQKKEAGKTNNFLYFYQEGDSYTRTFSHISDFQFKFLLSGILFKLLSQNEGFVLHASGVRRGKKATLFVGKSGAGKSTAVKLLRNKFAPIADNSIIIRKLNNKDFRCYQVPFSEKNDIGLRKKGGYIINKILFLKKSPYLNLVQLNNKQSIWKKLSMQLVIEKQYGGLFFKNLSRFTNEFNAFHALSFFIDEKKMVDYFNRF